MSERLTKIIDGTIQVAPFIQQLYSKIMKGLETGSVAIDLYRPDEVRSVSQNGRQWAMYTDIANQLEWHGQRLSKEDWKILLCHEWKPQSIIPAIGGGFCVLNAKTSKSEKSEMSALIEIIFAFGSQHGVKWSDPALKEYASYKEAQQ